MVGTTHILSDLRAPLLVRESTALRLLGRLRFLTAARLAELLFGGSSITQRSRAVLTQRVLASLMRRGLVARSRGGIEAVRRAQGSPVYYLTENGDRVARGPGDGLRRRLNSSGALLAPHALATADVLLAFQRAAFTDADHDLISWECDWEVALSLPGSPLVPDAYLLYRVGAGRLHAFIEIDLGTEHNRAISHKLRRYLALERAGTWRSWLPVWPYVLIVASTSTRAAQLRRLGELAGVDPAGTWRPGAHAFHFSVLADVISSPLGQVWRTVGKPEAISLLEGFSAPRLASPR